MRVLTAGIAAILCLFLIWISGDGLGTDGESLKRLPSVRVVNDASEGDVSSISDTGEAGRVAVEFANRENNKHSLDAHLAVLVVTEDGKPAQGVRIAIELQGVECAECTSDERGWARALYQGMVPRHGELRAVVVQSSPWAQLSDESVCDVASDSERDLVMPPMTVRKLEATVSGRVLAVSSGMPLQNAEVMIKMGPRKATRTDARGGFTLAVDDASECLWFGVIASGYNSVTVRGLPQGYKRDRAFMVDDIALEVGVDAVMSVRAASGGPLPGARVFTHRYPLWEGVADASGEIHLPGCKEGVSLEVMAAAKGYSPVRKTIVIRNGLRVDFDLEKERVIEIQGVRVDGGAVAGCVEVRGQLGSRRQFPLDERGCVALPLFAGDVALVMRVVDSCECMASIPHDGTNTVVMQCEPLGGIGGQVTGLAGKQCIVRGVYDVSGVWVTGLEQVDVDVAGVFWLRGASSSVRKLEFEIDGKLYIRDIAVSGQYALPL